MGDGKHAKKVDCSICHGTGKIKYSLDKKQVERDCSTCSGTGKI
jgi:DnaJ-class molecular chaperone